MTTPNAPAQIIFPWQPGYSPGVNVVPIIDNVLPWLAPVINPVINSVLPTPPAPPVPGPSQPPVAPAPPVVGNLTSVLEAAVLAAAEQAGRSALPAIQQQVLALLTSTVTTEVSKVLPQPTDTVIGPDVFTKAAARSRATRTFFTGLALSGVWGIISALGSLNGANFFTKTGLISVATLLASSAVGSVIAYVGRIHFQPAYVSQLPPPPVKSP